jgi:hypothetical protein
MMKPLKFLGMVLWSWCRSRAASVGEIVFLRQQLRVLRRSTSRRIQLRDTDRLIFVWLFRLFPSVLQSAVIFQPETLIRWRRSGLRLLWRREPRRRPGRPRIPADIRALIRRMSVENPLWGAPRVQGNFSSLGSLSLSHPSRNTWDIEAVLRHKDGGLSCAIMYHISRSSI